MDIFFKNFYSSPNTFFALLMFAIIGAGLYLWGLKKEQNQQKKLMNMLLNNAALKVLKYLKKNKKITKSQITNIILDTKASEVYSKRKAVVMNKFEFTNTLIDYMLKKELILKENKFYYLKKI